MTATANQVLVADGIFRLDDEGRPVLFGSRCNNCGNHMYPRQSGCPKCMFDDAQDIELAQSGTLWTWTVQAFPPKAPPYLGPVDSSFEPYGVGYVELDNEVRVETRLTLADPEQLKIGMAMEIVAHVLTTDDDGNEVVTYAFAPTSDSENGDAS